MLQEQLRVLHLGSVADSSAKTDVSFLQAPPEAQPCGLSDDAFLPRTDEDEHEKSTSFTMDDLKKCAIHVESLLEHIVSLQKSLDLCQSLAPHQRRHIHKSFTRYRLVFGADISRITIPPQQMLPTFSGTTDIAESMSEVPLPQSSADHHSAVLYPSVVVPSNPVRSEDVGRLHAGHLGNTSPARQARLQSTTGVLPAQIEPQISPYPHRSLRRTDARFKCQGVTRGSYAQHTEPPFEPYTGGIMASQQSDFGNTSVG